MTQGPRGWTVLGNETGLPQGRSEPPRMSDEEKATGFAEIMRLLRSRTPEELVLMIADVELAIADARILGEDLLADLRAADEDCPEGDARQA